VIFPQRIIVEEGQIVTFQCLVHGSVDWFYNELKLVNSSKLLRIVGNVILILRATRKFQGRYQCASRYPETEHYAFMAESLLLLKGTCISNLINKAIIFNINHKNNWLVTYWSSIFTLSQQKWWA